MIVAAWLGRRFGDAVEHADEDVGIEKDQRFPVAATGTIALPGCPEAFGEERFVFLTGEDEPHRVIPIAAPRTHAHAATSGDDAGYVETMSTGT